MKEHVDIDVSELIAQLKDQFSIAITLCRAGKREEREIAELLQQILDFNFTPEHKDVTPVEKSIMPTGPGIHHDSQVVVDSTRPNLSGRKDEPTQAIEVDLPGRMAVKNPAGIKSTRPPARRYHFGKKDRT